MEFIYTEGLLTKGYEKARSLVAEGKLSEARDLADYCIAVIGTERYENEASADDTLDGVRIGLWLERFWINILEKNGLML
jgi:hypothetical protein